MSTSVQVSPTYTYIPKTSIIFSVLVLSLEATRAIQGTNIGVGKREQGTPGADAAAKERRTQQGGEETAREATEEENR